MRLLSVKTQLSQVPGLQALLTHPLERQLLGVVMGDDQVLEKPLERGFLPVLTTSGAPGSPMPQVSIL